MNANKTFPVENLKHKCWVRGSHFIITFSFLALTFTGFVILMSHPRLYWGQAGNDLTPALFELPISRNYHHAGWEKSTVFTHIQGAPKSAARTYDIFNENGWGRSGHFLAAWFLVITGMVYLLAGILSGHFLKNLLPGAKQFSFKLFRADFRSHFHKQTATSNGPQYGLLQRITYLIVIFFLFPVVILSGFTMSPAITASYPFLIKMFFGEESARTIHFFSANLLVVFLVVHVVMVIRSGFKKNILAITFGK